jgi:hypothetical protein
MLDTDTDTDADIEIDQDVQGQTQLWGKSLLRIVSDDVKTIKTRIPKDVYARIQMYTHIYKDMHYTYLYAHIDMCTHVAQPTDAENTGVRTVNAAST